MEKVLAKNTNNYKPYCGELHFWILQKDDFNSSISIHPSIKYYFAEDFYADPSLPISIVKSIKKLLFSIDNQNDLAKWDSGIHDITNTIKDITILIKMVK